MTDDVAMSILVALLELDVRVGSVDMLGVITPTGATCVFVSAIDTINRATDDFEKHRVLVVRVLSIFR